MSKSFYDASTDQEALDIYRRGHEELYALMAIKVIRGVLDSINKTMSLSEMNVLEIGAAGGIWTDYFLKCGASVTCVDIREKILKANEKLHPQAKFLLADATDVELVDKFDLIFVKDVIEHIPDDMKFLNNMNRHQKKGGMILLNTQNSFCLNYLIQGSFHYLRGNWPWYGWDPTHVRFYNSGSLKKKLAGSGYKPSNWFGSYYLPYRLVSDHFGKWAENRIFCMIETLGLANTFPFSVTGWNIGVVAVKD